MSAASGRFSEPEVRHETSRRPAGSMRRLNVANLLSPERRFPPASSPLPSVLPAPPAPPFEGRTAQIGFLWRGRGGTFLSPERKVPPQKTPVSPSTSPPPRPVRRSSPHLCGAGRRSTRGRGRARGRCCPGASGRQGRRPDPQRRAGSGNRGRQDRV